MTAAVAIILPTIIVIGTFFGSILRKLSKLAQEQVFTFNSTKLCVCIICIYYIHRVLDLQL